MTRQQVLFEASRHNEEYNNEEYKWLAQDKGGYWYLYIEEPFLDFDEWRCSDHSMNKCQALEQVFEDNIPIVEYIGDWKESCIEFRL